MCAPRPPAMMARRPLNAMTLPHSGFEEYTQLIHLSRRNHVMLAYIRPSLTRDSLLRLQSGEKQESPGSHCSVVSIKKGLNLPTTILT